MTYASTEWALMGADQAAARQAREYENALADSQANTRQAEFWHGETLAVLVAALAEVRRLEPDSILLIPEVQDRIRRMGSDALRQAKKTDGQTFWQPVQDLKFDLPVLLAEVQAEHAAKRAEALKKLGRAVVEERRFFWRPWRKYARIKGEGFRLDFPTSEAAEAALERALELAQGAAMGGELGVEKLLRMK